MSNGGQKTPDGKSESIESLRQIVSMACHDLNNPMQVILGTIYLQREILDNLSLSPEERQRMEYLFSKIEGEIDYMKNLISEIKEWEAPLKPVLTEICLGDSAKEALSTISVPGNVKVIVDIEESFKVQIDPSMMRRVFVNMITNAIDAMPEGGDLLIRATKASDCLQISFEDTGIGIPEENIDKLFIPFFTTKPKGTGLGLPICKRIVEAHDGLIEFVSKAGEGAKFAISMKIGNERDTSQQSRMDGRRDSKPGTDQETRYNLLNWNAFTRGRRPVSSIHGTDCRNPNHLEY